VVAVGVGAYFLVDHRPSPPIIWQPASFESSSVGSVRPGITFRIGTPVFFNRSATVLVTGVSPVKVPGVPLPELRAVTGPDGHKKFVGRTLHVSWRDSGGLEAPGYLETVTYRRVPGADLEALGGLWIRYRYDGWTYRVFESSGITLCGKPGERCRAQIARALRALAAETRS
jgi:hypothetical protein